jgi:hypothetical protein
MVQPACEGSVGVVHQRFEYAKGSRRGALCRFWIVGGHLPTTSKSAGRRHTAFRAPIAGRWIGGANSTRNSPIVTSALLGCALTPVTTPIWPAQGPTVTRTLLPSRDLAFASSLPFRLRRRLGGLCPLGFGCGLLRDDDRSELRGETGRFPNNPGSRRARSSIGWILDAGSSAALAPFDATRPSG